jgi:hypothetical protein
VVQYSTKPPVFVNAVTDDAAASRSDSDLVDLVCRVTGALVYAAYRIPARRLRQAEDVTGIGIGPGLLEDDPFLVLDVQVGLMRGCEGFRCDTHHAGVDIHVLSHDSSPCCGAAEYGAAVIPGQP